MLLMHKDIPVAKMQVLNGKIVDVERIYDKTRLPVGVNSTYPQLMGRQLASWQEMRCIPQERQNRKRIEKILGCSVSEAMLRSNMLSMTDCYWCKDEDSDLSWNDVNLHKIGYSADLVELIMFADDYDLGIESFHSPDYTTDGMLEKAWAYIDEEPVLIKTGDLGPYAQGKHLLSANEVAAARIACLMEINHVPYFPILSLTIKNPIACGCPCFVRDDHTEFVNALQLAKHHKVYDEDLYRYFAENGFEREIQQMILFDHLIHNNDRHEKNFGILRNADTLECIGIAPLFDSGSSFGWNQDKETTKPFAKKREEQLLFLNDFTYDVPKLSELKNIVEEVYQEFKVPEESYARACADIAESVEMLDRMHWR